MPELPEVETTVSGLRPHLLNKRLSQVTFYRSNLRFPLEKSWETLLSGKKITSIRRRAKFVVCFTDTDCAFTFHLGMSGSLRVTLNTESLKKHDHIAMNIQESDKELRFHDPRRFGWLSVFSNQMELDSALSQYGVEPLSEVFTSLFLFQYTKSATRPIKTLIMDQKVVVGVGNIYACEALFLSKILPTRKSNSLTKAECAVLVGNIKMVLNSAIQAGGTTLKDFTNPDAQPGYFAQTLQVYGRVGKTCYVCESEINSKKITGRNTFFCATCQK